MLEQGVGQASDVNQAGLTRQQQQQQQCSSPLAGVCSLRFPPRSPGLFSTFPGAFPGPLLRFPAPSPGTFSTFPGAAQNAKLLSTIVFSSFPACVFYVSRCPPPARFLRFPAGRFYVSRRPPPGRFLRFPAPSPGTFSTLPGAAPEV